MPAKPSRLNPSQIATMRSPRSQREAQVLKYTIYRNLIVIWRLWRQDRFLPQSTTCFDSKTRYLTPMRNSWICSFMMGSWTNRQSANGLRNTIRFGSKDISCKLRIYGLWVTSSRISLRRSARRAPHRKTRILKRTCSALPTNITLILRVVTTNRLRSMCLWSHTRARRFNLPPIWDKYSLLRTTCDWPRYQSGLRVL